MLQPRKDVLLKIIFLDNGCLLPSLKIERENLRPGPGPVPGSPALHDDDLTTELSKTSTDP